MQNFVPKSENLQNQYPIRGDLSIFKLLKRMRLAIEKQIGYDSLMRMDNVYIERITIFQNGWISARRELELYMNERALSHKKP